MIPQEVRSHFQSVVGHGMFDEDRRLEQAMGATVAKAAAQGMLQSGRVIMLLTEDARNSLEARAHYILGQLLRCLAAHDVALTPDTVVEASALLDEFIGTQASSLRHKLVANNQFSPFGFLKEGCNQVLAQFDREAPRLISKTKTELELGAAAANRPTSKAGPNLTFHGPVGLVQTGDGSQATVHQHIDSGVKNQLVSALNFCLQELDKEENRSLGNLAELKELVSDTRAEAEKPTSNTLKLAAGLRTVAETTKFVGSLGSAYQVLKPLLSYFGVHLPG